MGMKTRYAVVLAAGLLLVHLAGELLEGTPYRPHGPLDLLLNLFFFLTVFFALLRRTASEEGGITFRRGLRLGEAVVRRVALLVASVASVYGFFWASFVPVMGGAYQFGWHSAETAGVFFFAVLLLTWLFGVVAAAFCSWIVQTQTQENGAQPAA